MNGDKFYRFDKHKILNLVPFFAVFLIILLWFFSIPTNYGDHIWYYNQLKEQGIEYFIKNLYLTENSKLLLDLLTVFIGQYKFIWVPVTAFLFAFLGYNISDFFTSADIKANATIALLLLIYPLGYMYSAGWPATLINYIWTASLGLYTLKPLVLFLNGKPIEGRMLPLYILSLVISCNHEQIAAIVVAFYIIMIAYALYKKIKVPTIMYIMLALSIVSLLFLLITPENSSRSENSLHMYPAFESFDVIHKVYLGIVSTIPEMLVSPNGIVVLLAFIIPYIYMELSQRVGYGYDINYTGCNLYN